MASRLESWCSRLTDAQILSAERPDGYDADYMKWPDGAYARWGFHAYHCRQLIGAIRAARAWVGPPLLLYDDGQVDGNHRLRAVLYLRGQGMVITVPVRFASPPRIGVHGGTT